MIKVSGADPVLPSTEKEEEPADLNQEDLKTLLSYMDSLKALLANPISVSSAEKKKSEKTIKQLADHNGVHRPCIVGKNNFTAVFKYYFQISVTVFNGV